MTTDHDTFSSGAYWEKRYKAGGSSGVGSTGVLANYKTAFLNWTFRRLSISSVIDFGCGDGEQIKRLACRNYTGVDASPFIVEACRESYKDRPNWRFFTADQEPEYAGTYDAAMSIDVIYHLVEDDVFHTHMRQLFQSAAKAVIIYSSDWDEVAPALHVRHRWFSRWIAQHAPDWTVSERHANPYPFREDDHMNTTFASFTVCTPAAG